MYIVLSDHQELISPNERQQLYDRVLFSMARFAHRINSVTVHVSDDPTGTGHPPACVITISVEDSGLVTVGQSAGTLMTAATLAVEALESEVAHRVGCRHSFRLGCINNWGNSVSRGLKRLFDLENRLSASWN